MATYYTPRSIQAVNCSGPFVNAGVVKHDTYDYHFKPGSRLKPKDFLFQPTAITHSKSVCHDQGVFLATSRQCYDPVLKVYRAQPGTWDGSLYNSFGVGRPTVVEPVSLSTNAILSKIKHEGVNLAIMFAEYKKTASMFEQSAVALARLYADIRAGRVKRILKRGSRNSSSTWLLARYGVTPLVYDMVNTMNELSDNLSYSYLFRRYTVWTRSSKCYYYERSFTPPESLAVKRTLISERESRLKYVANVEYAKPDLAYISHLGLTNPIAVGWELIPFSFVLDWFINVGDSLSNLDALSGVSRVSCTKCVRSTTKESWPGITTGLLENYARTVISLGTPPLPRWEPSLSWKRIVDSVTLLHRVRQNKISADTTRKAVFTYL